MKAIEAAILSVIAIFIPIQAILLTTLAFITMDLISGVLSAKKQKEPITSQALRRTVTKIFVYEIALMIGFLAEHYMIEYLPIVKMVSSMIAITELKSIYENIDILGGGDLLKSVIGKLGSDNSKKDSD